MTKVESFGATIYCGLKHGYDGVIMPFEVVEGIIQEWVDKIGMCVTCTRTEYIYSNGKEPGVIVGFINYPRFPSTPEDIRLRALDLAQILLRECHQMRLSIVFPDETIMLSNMDEVAAYVAKKESEA